MVTSSKPGLRLGTAVLTLLVVLATGVAVVAAAVESGAPALGWGLFALGGVCLVVLLVVGLAWPRTAPLTTDPDGAVRLAAPAVLVAAALGGWFSVLASAGVWGWLMVTDFSRVDPAGPIVIVVLGAVGSLVDLVRLLTGRLHRWSLVLDDTGITYQGYRRRVHEPWSAVRGAQVTWERRREGVLVDLKASRPDLLVPWPAFLVHPQVLAHAISERAGSRR